MATYEIIDLEGCFRIGEMSANRRVLGYVGPRFDNKTDALAYLAAMPHEESPYVAMARSTCANVFGLKI